MRNARWLDARRFHSEQARHQENSARQASCFITYAITGAGETIVNVDETFHTPFFGEPAVQFGCHLAVAPDLDAYYLPRVTGGVFRWVVKGKDRYVGMFPYFTVDVETRPDVTDPPALGVEIIAHLTFTGLSYKAMGERVPGMMDAAIPARAVVYTP